MPPTDPIGTERVFCDYCDASGRRSLLFPAPVGWLYIASVDAATGQTYYVFACGPACRDQLWLPGPGPVLPGMAAQVSAAIQVRGGLSDAPSATPPPPSSAPARAPDRGCIFDERVCKAANCPTHGWSKNP